MAVTLTDMVKYYCMLSQIHNPSEQIKEVLEKLEQEIHTAITTLRSISMEFK